MGLVTYQCCICGEHINERAKLDPCFVSLLSNLEGSESEQLEQAIFCHYHCFKNSLDPGVTIHLNFEEQNKKSRGQYMAPAKIR